jgi:hypothetical protein
VLVLLFRRTTTDPGDGGPPSYCFRPHCKCVLVS